MGALADFDPFAPETVETPYGFYAALRREAPVYELPGAGYALVSRYADVRHVVMQPEEFSSNLVAVFLAGSRDVPELVSLPSRGPQPVDVLALADPPLHTRHRKLANKSFSMRRVAGLEPAVRALARRLVDGLRGEGGDWMAEVARPLPMTVIADLIGFPREDIPRLEDWSDHSVGVLSGINTAEELAGHARAIGELNGYLAARFDEARRRPGAGVLGDLVRATREQQEALSRDEAISILLQLLTAGNETTTSLIGSALLLLLEHPELQARLRADPSLLPAFVEEALRLESPFQGHFRLVRRTTELAGVRLVEGTRLMLLWGSANRDEAEFAEPERIDLARAGKAHVGFGHGIHHCIGAALARLETRVVLETLFERTREVRLASPEVRHVPSLFVRRLASLVIAAR